MEHKEIVLKSVDGLALYGQYWVPENEAGGVICLVHGLGEHSSRYEQWALRFVEKGFAFTAFDLRGHGHSEGKKGHTPSYVRLMEDIDIFLQRSRDLFPGIPLFLYGHSMGGNLVLGYAVRVELSVAGIISTSPWLRLRKEMPGIVMAPFRIVQYIAPGLVIRSGLDAAGISRDKEVVIRYMEDPLVHDKISLKMFFEIHDNGLKLIRNGGEIKTPVLLIHGSDDPITDPEGSRLFAEKAGGGVTLKIFDGLYHETHNEPEKEEVFEYIFGWMKERMKKGNVK